MPLKFKERLTDDQEVERALRRRVQDNAHRTFSNTELDTRIKIFLNKGRTDSVPTLEPGQLLSSIQFKEFLADTKFHVGMANGRMTSLETQIRNSTKEAFGTLNDIQQEVLVLDSSITEEETRILHGFTTVHFNAFVRQIDFALDFDSPDWLVDYKTNITFLERHKSRVLPSTGLTLPIRDQLEVPITNAVLVGEETDVGDSKTPIVSTNARNLLFQNKTFRHVIIRREFDKTSRKYIRGPSYCTILLELANTQLVNSLTVKPLGQSTLLVDQLTFINEAGEEVELTLQSLTAETNITLLFEPVRTRYLKIKFKQYAPVTKTWYENKDLRVSEVNKILRGVGFSQLLNSETEEIQGRVFDFSIETIQASLIVYENLGIFRSLPVKVENPLGLAISNKVEVIHPSSDQRAYGVQYFLPEGIVLDEYYVGVDLKDSDSNRILYDLIPVPDSYPIQREFLPLIGAVGKVKLFPNTIWAWDEVLITQVEEVASQPFVIVTTAEPHDVAVDERITFLGRQNHPLNGEYVVDKVIDTFSFRVYLGGTTSTGYEIEADTFPTVSYLDKSFVEEAPLNVHKEGVALTLGQDYKISLDSGTTWFTDWPSGTELIKALRLARSGRFYVKILEPEYDKIYWIEYRPLHNQFLGNTNLVSLKNGRVVFDERLQGTSGELYTVIVQRADNDNPYITPVTLFYSLKVRENVS